MILMTRDGTAKPVSRGRILRREPRQGNIVFLVQLATSRIDDHTRLIYVVVCCCCCCLHIKNRSDLYPVPFSFLLFKAKKRISVVTS